MTTSASYDFNASRDTLINGALRLAGVLDPEGGVASATQLSLGGEALNMMVKTWQTGGLYLWKRQMVSIPLVSGTATYTSDSPKVLRLKDAYIRSSTGSDTPLRIVSREEYNKLGNKSSTGTPSQIWYDPQLATGTYTVYPVPNMDGYTLYVEVELPIQDFDASSDTPDLPQEWLAAIKFNLALQIGPEYGMSEAKFKMIKMLADESLGMVKSFDQEQSSVYFGFSPY